MDTSTGNLIWAAPAILVALLLFITTRHLRTLAQQQRQDDMLRPEIDSNLEMLRGYWARMRPRESREDEVHSMQKRLYAREFASIPLPPFSRQAFERQRASHTRSGNAKKAAGVANFYADLDRLDEIQRELQAALAESERGPNGSTGPSAGGDPDYAEFLRIAGREWDDAWHRIERLLANGNPL